MSMQTAWLAFREGPEFKTDHCLPRVVRIAVDHLQQLIVRPRFLQIADGARLEGALLVLPAVSARHHDNRNIRDVCGSEVFQELKTINGRQPEIQNNQLRIVRLTLGEGAWCILGEDRFVVAGIEKHLITQTHVGVVLNDQNGINRSRRRGARTKWHQMDLGRHLTNTSKKNVCVHDKRCQHDCCHPDRQSQSPQNRHPAREFASNGAGLTYLRVRRSSDLLFEAGAIDPLWGDALLEFQSSHSLSEALQRCTGRVDTHVLHRQYAHLSGRVTILGAPGQQLVPGCRTTSGEWNEPGARH